MNLHQLSESLLAQSQVHTPLDPPPELSSSKDDPISSWFIHSLIAASAYIASLFLLLFFYLVLNSVSIGFRYASLLIGLCSCTAAIIIFATLPPRAQFLPNCALALSFAGQIALGFFLSSVESLFLLCIGMLAIEVFLFFAVKHSFHRFLCVLLAASFWGLSLCALIMRDLESFAPPLATATSLPAWSLLVWLLTFLPLAAAAYWLVRQESRFVASPTAPLYASLTTGLVASLAISPLTQIPNIFFSPTPAYSWLAVWSILAALLACFSGALAFYQQNRPLLGLAILMALSDLSTFYYALSVSLLAKAAVMIVLGVAFLLTANYLARRNPA